MLLHFEPYICRFFYKNAETGLSFQIKQNGKVLGSIRLRADENTQHVCEGVNKIRSSVFMFLFCVTVPVAHLLLSEEGRMGLWPPGSADGE